MPRRRVQGGGYETRDAEGSYMQLPVPFDVGFRHQLGVNEALLRRVALCADAGNMAISGSELSVSLL